jgi:hypothetical protein
LGTAFACVVALLFLFSGVGELREKWTNSKSLGRFVLSVFGVSSGAPSSGYSEYLASYEQSSKALGASGKLWVSTRSLQYSSTEEFLRKCLQLKAITERLDADAQRFAAVCKQAKQHERDWSKSKADRFRMEVCRVSVSGYEPLVALQRRQLSALEDATAGWWSGAKPLGDLERLASGHEQEIERQFTALLTAVRGVLEDSTGNVAPPFEAHDINLIRPR